MLSFFRFNDPYRLIFIFLLLLLIRLPVFLSDNALTEADLRYMVIGEKMNNGAKLYIEIWDNIAPLAAGVYWLLDGLFGRSLLAYQLIALLLVTFQAALFNRMLLSNKAINENSYVPALIYGLCMSLFFDFFTLSPMLMSITFLLFALNQLFDHIEIRAKRDEQIFSIGLFIGVAALFYLPVILLAPAILLILLMFTGTVFRRYLLLSFGVVLPLLLLIGYYLLIDGVRDFYYNFFNLLASIIDVNRIKFTGILLILAVPMAFMVLGILKIIQGIRFTNYQTRLTQVMFVWLLFSIIILIPGDNITPAKLVILVPPMAFYIVHYFLAFRKNLKSEIAFSIFIVWIGLLSLGTFYNTFFTTRFINYKTLLIEPTKYDDLVKDKNVVVLGSNIHVYKNAGLATPFFNWNLSREIFTSPEYYDNVVRINKAFQKDTPDVIIDEEGVLDKVKGFIPLIEQKYTRQENEIYILNN